jgi:hypothetical protein
MQWEKALRARLMQDPAVAALVGAKVDWDERPQSDDLPAITLVIVDEPTGQNFEEADGLQRVMVQIDGWAKDAPQRKALKEAVKAALLPRHTGNGIRFDRAFVSVRDGTERTETQLIYRTILNFTFHYAAQ